MKLAALLHEQLDQSCEQASPVRAQFAAGPEAVRSLLAPYAPWYERVVGEPWSELLIVELDIPWEHLVVPELLPGTPLHWNDDIASLPPDRPRIRRFELPDGAQPFIDLTSVLRADAEQGWRVKWTPAWRDLPVALWFEELSLPVVAMKVNFIGYSDGPEERTACIWLLPRSVASAALALLGRSLVKPRKEIVVYGNRNLRLPADSYRWDRVVLDPSTRRTAQDDFELFLRSREWFEENGLPYRRGYLFYGAPGNGKTSAIRVMAAHPMVSPLMIDLGSESADNGLLTRMFEHAGRSAPALIIFEDLDRMFAPEAPEEKRRQVTLQHLLNCLDGIGNEDGIIVVATANEPAHLDPAILRRPGRFDRVVEFRSPAVAERREYFRRQKSIKMEECDLEAAGEITEDFSFAQLRESFILAGQLAFSERSAIGWPQLEQAVGQIKASQRDLSRSSVRRPLGFDRLMKQA